MSGQGYQIFADALAGAGLARLADRVRAPLRVGVGGRRGVGVSTVVAALRGAGFDAAHRAEANDWDVDVYVVAEVLKPEDDAALAAARRPAYVVFTKADLAGFGPGGPLSRARRQADRLTAPAGSRYLFEHVSSVDKRLEIYPGLFHEIYNEPEQAAVLDDLVGWFDAHVPGGN